MTSEYTSRIIHIIALSSYEFTHKPSKLHFIFFYFSFYSVYLPTSILSVLFLTRLPSHIHRLSLNEWMRFFIMIGFIAVVGRRFFFYQQTFRIKFCMLNRKSRMLLLFVSSVCWTEKAGSFFCSFLLYAEQKKQDASSVCFFLLY